MRGFHRAAVLVLALCVAGLAGGPAGPRPAAPGEVRIAAPGAGGFFRVPVKAMTERRFLGVIRQQYDFSCGSAAVASLLTYHYGRPTSEQDVFLAMWNVGDRERIRQSGFSLLDMKAYLATRGLNADGFRVPLDKLEEAGIPAITLIDLKGYKHFVLVKGMRDGRVLVGDPALGVKEVPQAEFERMWNGILFVVHDDMEAARETFNPASVWAVNSEAPLGAALLRSGPASLTLNLPGRNESFR
jgi:uncharacterized protein